MESERIDSLMRRNDDRNWEDHRGERKKEREKERKKSFREKNPRFVRFDSIRIPPDFPKFQIVEEFPSEFSVGASKSNDGGGGMKREWWDTRGNGHWMEEGGGRKRSIPDLCWFPRQERRDVERRYEPRADLISRLAAVIASLASTADGVSRVRPSFVPLIPFDRNREKLSGRNTRRFHGAR